jgi:hypothetical protein
MVHGTGTQNCLMMWQYLIVNEISDVNIQSNTIWLINLPQAGVALPEQCLHAAHLVKYCIFLILKQLSHVKISLPTQQYQKIQNSLFMEDILLPPT